MTKELIAFEPYNEHQIHTVRHDTGSKEVVIFCHGFRSSNIGPARSFVRVARRLEGLGISSVRFDQFGCGNSEGDFAESSFDDWVDTITDIVQSHLDAGFRVGLFGQSMGASASIVVGARSDQLSAIVAWVPDPNVDKLDSPAGSFYEEGGQIVRPGFWQEAHAADISRNLTQVRCPTYIVQCTDDEYVDEVNREAIRRSARPDHLVETFSGYRHSNWTFAQFEEIIDKSIDFLLSSFRARPG